MALPLNRETSEWADTDALVDSVHSAFDFDTVTVQVFRDQEGNFERLKIRQISTGAAIDPNADTTYDSAPNSSFFDDNAGLRWRKTSATAWTSTEA